MGILWDLVQHGQIKDVSREQESMGVRMARLEDQLLTTNRTLMKLIEALEERFGEDLDGDDRVGRAG